ncbi:polyadenylate-binding protein-interacting protein 1 [Bacillus rossius redtenbacheri]|uniref:polyadenylate-binding protein-interacting protein 1 n=1 Tax=Bacillus rossius redtenbacheri TaxID=93214 RepID=UPI002FDE2F06
MANPSRCNLGIGRGRGRAHGATPDAAVNQQPHIKPDSGFAHANTETLQSSVSVSQDDVSTYDPGAGGDTIRNSRLSAEANEFYPRDYKHAVASGDGPTDVEKEMMPSEVVASRLLDAVNSITVEPGAYQRTVDPFLESFGPALADPQVVSTVLNIIIEQSILQPNFCYNGARLCKDLSEFLANNEKINIRTILLERCRNEVDLVLEYVESNPRHLQGFVTFLAELYIQLELKPGMRFRIGILGNALHELLQVLASNPTPENIKCACMTLKLAGYALDQDDTTAMDTLLQSLHKVAVSPSTSKSVASMIANINQLRLASWGMSNATEPGTTVTDYFQHLSVEDAEPVFYGPDGHVLSHEESEFLQENLASEVDYEESWLNGNPEYECEGEMNEEEEEAYEEFLRMNENKQKL